MPPLADSAPSAPTPPPSLLLPPDILHRLDFAKIFGNGRPVELELGCGDGSFLLKWSALHPERNFVGVERLKGRVTKIDRKGRRQGLINLRGLRLEAAYVLEWMIPAASLSALHVYFPDPWPKKRHHKRRLIQTPFTELAARALRPDGVLYLRTDHAGYFQQMEEVMAATTAFERLAEPAGLLDVKTDFEVGFNAEGKPTRHGAWRRRAVAEPFNTIPPGASLR